MLRELETMLSVAVVTSTASARTTFRHFRTSYDADKFNIDVIPAIFEMLGLPYGAQTWQMVVEKVHLADGGRKGALRTPRSVDTAETSCSRNTNDGFRS